MPGGDPQREAEDTRGRGEVKEIHGIVFGRAIFDIFCHDYSELEAPPKAHPRPMRIIAGDLARRSLITPKGNNTRPTTDRVREALFQHLELGRLDGGFRDLRVLDLFAGSGALAIESISRGAAAATLLESDKRALNAIRANVTTLGLAERTTVISGRLPRALRRVRGEFDLIFADPPYSLAPLEELAVDLARLSSEGALLVYEHGAREEPRPMAGWSAPESRPYGETAVTFYRRLDD